MSNDPTPEMVRGLWSLMTSHYGSEVVTKGDSTVMRLAASALQLFGVNQAAEFMSDYTTTIGKTIFVPFTIGVDSSDWPLWEQIVICVHEHMHVYQWTTEGVTFAARYLISSSARAEYEAEAYRSESELSWWRSKQIIAPATLAAHLTGYGCTQADIASASQIISLSEETIKRGGIVNPPTRIALDWLSANAPGLRSS